MVKIKPMPVHIREYYKAMRDAYTQRKEEALKEIEELTNDSNVLQQDILNRHEVYLEYNINLLDLPEFVNNEYKDGHFLRIAKGAYLNKANDYELTTDLFNLLKLAEMQEKIVKLSNDVIFYDKLLSVKANDYVEYIRTYFNEVHKKMIIEGCAYSYSAPLGIVIINRVKVNSKRKLIDYKATKQKKAEIIARGGRVYNKSEAEFCERNGFDYNGEDGRVYKTDEYFYEIFMKNNRFENATMFEYKPQDYRAVELRGKTNDMLIEECGGDLNKICELKVDLKTKLILCNQVDKMLYTNFIRNENQTSYKYSETSR